MRNTRRTLLVSGSLAVGGLVFALFGIWMFESQGESWGSLLPLLVGLAVGPIALVFFISSAVSGLRKERLESGAGEIARWRVLASEWAAFREQEKRFAAAGRPPNALNLREGPPIDGDVIFAAKAVIADEDYHDLIPGGLDDLQSVQWVQGTPSCLEFHFTTRRGAGSSETSGFSFTHSYLRVPVAAEEGREATKVLAHYRKKDHPTGRRHRDEESAAHHQDLPRCRRSLRPGRRLGLRQPRGRLSGRSPAGRRCCWRNSWAWGSSPCGNRCLSRPCVEVLN